MKQIKTSGLNAIRKSLSGFLGTAFFLLVLATAAQSAVYYASPSGNASWNNAQSQTTPCSLLLAMENARAGDEVRILAGSYAAPGQGNRIRAAFRPANSGTSGDPIVFKAYPEGAPVSLTLSSGSGPVIGVNGGISYIHFIGMKITEGVNFETDCGTVSIRGGNGCLIENCEIIGRTRTVADNHDGIRIENSDYITVRNCYIRGFKGSDWNDTGIKYYGSSHNLVEYCTFYDNSLAIFDKRGTNEYNTYRYNLFDRNGAHFKMYSNRYYPISQYHVLHNNVFLETDSSIGVQEHCVVQIGANGNVSNIDVYNNTFYNCENTTDNLGAIQISNIGPNVRVWNNLLVDIDHRVYVVMAKDINSGNLAYSDYNQIYNCNSRPFALRYSTTYTLSEWINTYDYEDNIVTTNPGFKNPGGTSATDYQRTSYPHEGRGGDYQPVIGAWISDDYPSQIGYVSGSSVPAALEITTASLPNAIEGKEYSITLNAAGGVEPYNWSIISGTLPDGLALSGATISGTASESAIGESTFTVQVEDNNQTVYTKQFTLVVTEAPLANLANGSTCIANSENFRDSYELDNLWDGVLTGSGSSAASTATGSFWVEYDLGEMYDISMIRFYGDARGSWVSREYSVLVSNDGIDYTAYIDHDNAFANDPITTLPESLTTRYIRLEVYNEEDSLIVQAFEFEVFGTESSVIDPEPSPLTNLALGKTAVNVGTPLVVQEDYMPEHAIDGDLETRWAVKPKISSMEVDLGAVYSISATEVVSYASRGYQFTVSISSDGETFTQVVDESGTNEQDEVRSEFEAVNARYVRLNITGANNYTNNYTGIVEFRIFGTETTELSFVNSLFQGNFQ